MKNVDLTGATSDRASFSFDFHFEEHPDRPTDLSGSNLSNASFRQSRMNGVNFSKANLSAADLSGATLKHAKFMGAILSGAILTGADLEGAKLEGAKYSRVTKFPDGFQIPLAMVLTEKIAFSIQGDFVVGEKFDVWVVIDTANTVAGWEFDLHFDAGILNAVDVSEGSFFSLEEGKTFFQKGEIDNKLGQ